MHKKLFSTLSRYQKIILVGGGTGGHIQPILSIVHEIRGRSLLWIGGKGAEEETAAKNANIEFKSISTLKLSTTKSWQVFLYPFVLMQGIFEARKILSSIRLSDYPTIRPLCVFSKGGPGSVAVGIATWSLGIPLYLHESDTIPGRSNRILGKIATKIFLGFESARIYFDPKKCEVIGQILDPVFENKKDKIQDAKIHWKTTKPHILVICGSQGSQIMFQEIVKNYSGNNEYEWIIALGKLNSGMKGEFEKIPDCQALEWISQSDIAHLIQDTDLAITRGSATTLAELTSFRSIELSSHKAIKLIIIPLPYSADNHQHYNALEYQKMGHVILEQKNLDQLTQIITQHVGHNS